MTNIRLAFSYFPYLIIGALGWLAMSTGACLYTDLNFLHQARVINDQQRQAPAPVPPPQKVDQSQVHPGPAPESK